MCVSYICSLGAAFLSGLQVTRENWAPEPDKDIQLAGVHGRPQRPVRAELELGDILYWRSTETRYRLISSGCCFSNFSVGISNIHSAHMAVGFLSNVVTGNGSSESGKMDDKESQ